MFEGCKHDGTGIVRDGVVICDQCGESIRFACVTQPMPCGHERREWTKNGQVCADCRAEMPAKPPLGIMPEWRWRELRVAELCDAIARKTQVNHDPIEQSYYWRNAHEWAVELLQHVDYLQIRERACRVKEKLDAYEKTALEKGKTVAKAPSFEEICFERKAQKESAGEGVDSRS